MKEKEVVSAYITNEAKKVLTREARRRNFKSLTAFVSTILEGWVVHFQLRGQVHGKENRKQKKHDM